MCRRCRSEYGYNSLERSLAVKRCKDCRPSEYCTLHAPRRSCRGSRHCREVPTLRDHDGSFFFFCDYHEQLWQDAAEAIAADTGAAVGAGGLLAIALTYNLLRKVEGMGLGDVKMMAMLGAVLGWEPLLPLLVIASFSGAIVGVFVAWKSGQGMQVALPFGVFLGLAFLVMVFFGNELNALWSNLLLIYRFQ